MACNRTALANPAIPEPIIIIFILAFITPNIGLSFICFQQSMLFSYSFLKFVSTISTTTDIELVEMLLPQLNNIVFNITKK
jgi:hypothetical protein